MTEYDRDEAACHLCFQDNALQDWIKEEGRKGGVCPWCGRRGNRLFSRNRYADGYPERAIRLLRFR